MIVSGNKSLRDTTEVADKQIKRVLETVDGVGERIDEGDSSQPLRKSLDGIHGTTGEEQQRIEGLVLVLEFSVACEMRE